MRAHAARLTPLSSTSVPTPTLAKAASAASSFTGKAGVLAAVYCVVGLSGMNAGSPSEAARSSSLSKSFTAPSTSSSPWAHLPSNRLAKAHWAYSSACSAIRLLAPSMRAASCESEHSSRDEADQSSLHISPSVRSTVVAVSSIGKILCSDGSRSSSQFLSRSARLAAFCDHSTSSPSRPRTRTRRSAISQVHTNFTGMFLEIPKGLWSSVNVNTFCPMT